MIFAIITLLSGLSISVVAAYYSIIGLTTIFSGSIMAVAIMGAVLEVGKLVTASWLKQNWNEVGFFMKSYLTLAVVVLMFITSMGIFGYLSKAHLQQTSGIDYNRSKVEKINFNIGVQEKKIERSQAILDRLDSALEAYIEREYITRALKERKNQKEERDSLHLEITQATQKIEELSKEKFKYQQKVQEIEVEVGPLKYIADLIYGEEKSKDMLNEAVRAVILVLIFVFDPLAVLMLLAANVSFNLAFQKRREASKDNEQKEQQIDDKDKNLTNHSPENWTTTTTIYKPINDEDEEVSEENLDGDKNVDEYKSASKKVLDFADNLEEPGSSMLAQGPPVEELHEEPDPKIPDKIKTSKEEERDPYNILPLPMDKPEGMKEKVWQDKLLKQAENFAEHLKENQGISLLTKEDMLKAIEQSFEQAINKANIPFNLNSPEGEELKKIIINNLQKEYKTT